MHAQKDKVGALLIMSGGDGRAMTDDDSYSNVPASVR